jgi:hypothetical protein
MTPRRALEKAVEAQIDRLCALAGCTAIRFSQARASMQTPGIPDRLYFAEARHAPDLGLAFFVEVKAAKGVQSAAQKWFEGLCTACGVPYVCGGYREVLTFLVNRGLWRLPEGITVDHVCRGDAVVTSINRREGSITVTDALHAGHRGRPSSRPRRSTNRTPGVSVDAGGSR